MTSRADMEAALEAILFVASEPASRERLLAVFDEGERAAAAEALDAVLHRYRSTDDGRGLLVDEAGGGIRLVTRPELHGYLRRFFEVSGKNKLSMAALETLAIVGYRQPVTAPEIQELRGVSSIGVLKTLLDRRLVRIAGRKEVVGKPFLYATTKEFLLHFGLQTIKDLPPLEEFEDALSAEGASVRIDGPDREEEVFKQAALLAELEDEVTDEAAVSEGEGESGEEMAGESGEEGAAPLAAVVDSGAEGVAVLEAVVHAGAESGDGGAASEETVEPGEVEARASDATAEETPLQARGPAAEETVAPKPTDAVPMEDEGGPLSARVARVVAAEEGESEADEPPLALAASSAGDADGADPLLAAAEAQVGARDEADGGGTAAVTAGARDERAGG